MDKKNADVAVKMETPVTIDNKDIEVNIKLPLFFLGRCLWLLVFARD